INDLMEVSAQFGHKPSITHPSMKRREYIFGEIKNIAILNLDKTIVLLESACKYLESVAAKGGKFLFVGIRKNIQEEVAECAKKSGSYYVNKRWTPGLLTNFNTLKLNLTRRNDLQKSVDKEKNLYTKKEILGMRREIESIDSVYGGLKEIYDLPNCVIILDASCQKIAIEEARKKKIPIVAICDSNCDIKDIDYPIPANDDNKKSVSFIAEVLNDFIINGISLKVQQKNKIHTDEKRTFQRGDNFQNNKLQERIKGGFFQKPRQNQDGLQNTEKTFNKTGEGQSTFFKPRTFTPRTGEGQATFFKPRTFSPRVGEGQQTFFKPITLTNRTV
ncbi:MAG: 30S ribosomal protein S2, partial [Bacteroidota bacterium]